MATVSVVLSSVSNNARSGLNAVMPVPDAVPAGKDSVTSSAASQQAAVTSPAEADGLFWTITATGGNVWVQFGTDPTASAGNDHLLIDGVPRDYAAAGSQKVAVIDA